MRINMTDQEYKTLAQSYVETTPWFGKLLCAYGIGGGVCALGHGLGLIWQALDWPKQIAAIATPVSLIFLSALFTALGIFDDIALVGGAGVLVPITGFANAVVAPAMEYKSEGLVMGMGARLFSIAGPVLVFGVVASTIYGVFLLIIH